MRWAKQASAADVETCRRFASATPEDFACNDYVSQIIGASPSPDSHEWRERHRTGQQDLTASEGKLQWWGHVANAPNITGGMPFNERSSSPKALHMVRVNQPSAPFQADRH